MRITSKGQVAIPKEIREQAGLLPHTVVEFLYDGEDVRLTPVKKSKMESRGEMAVRPLRGSATAKMSTDEIMALTRGE